ncbi:helix-turn-helix domain-containing protein [Nocardia miyunensis]|uniref:helix-turn-helix domain-containing protein n=1 Tax=Nocardia miyunensis TaxID=282684 RepID=UPI0009FFCBE9|nr:helix-turn-helix domain-containing protein [Nocardia miyunensis]
MVDAARAAFIEQGGDVGIDAIARRAGVGATTFYRHFPTKEALVEELLTEPTEGSKIVRTASGSTPGCSHPYRVSRTIAPLSSDDGAFSRPSQASMRVDIAA